MKIGKNSHLAIIVKPTYGCNLACSYCSVAGNDTAPRMTLDTVDKLLERVVDFCGEARTVYLIWHGGEPLLMGANFYDYVGNQTKKFKGVKIVNSIQTNATLINDEIIDVLVRHKYRVSTSIDGPAAVHDNFRRYADGRPTYDEVIEAVRLLKRRRIPVGAIAVLTKSNKDHLPEVYELFNQMGVHLRINPVQLHGNASQNRLEVAVTPREYGQVMIRIFDMWYHDPEAKIVVDPFRLIIGNIVTGYNYGCEFRRQCHAEVMSVGPDGSVYPCGQFSGGTAYYLGNIHNHSFEDIMAVPTMKRLLARVPENIDVCSHCQFSEICNCGCTASAVCRGRGIMQPDYYCGGRKMLYQHITDTIEGEIERVRKIQALSCQELLLGNIN